MPRSSQFQYPNDSILGDLPAVPPSAGAFARFARLLSSLGRSIADTIHATAHSYAAAALYEQLSRLSDAELHRRGLSRDILARDICAACDPPGPRR